MLNKFIKKRSDELTSISKLVYEDLSRSYGYTARVSMIWELLARSFGLPEFEILDFNNYQNGEFESYLIDRYREWWEGKDVDFSLIGEAILTVGDFTRSEKLLLLDGNNLAERVWAIYKVISDPLENLNIS